MPATKSKQKLSLQPSLFLDCSGLQLLSSMLVYPIGVSDLPAELSRCFLLIRELDQKSTALQAEVNNRCRKHVTDHAAEHEVVSLTCSVLCLADMQLLYLHSSCD